TDRMRLAGPSGTLRRACPHGRIPPATSASTVPGPEPWPPRPGETMGRRLLAPSTERDKHVSRRCPPQPRDARRLPCGTCAAEPCAQQGRRIAVQTLDDLFSRRRVNGSENRRVCPKLPCAVCPAFGDLLE